jgi:threonine synthase
MTIRYISTRGAAPPASFEDVLLGGLAPDGGLYLPDAWPALPDLPLAALARLDYADLALAVIRPFVGGAIDDDALSGILRAAYADFGHPAVTPLRQMAPNLWLLELFHGPTLAFKDLALQLLGRLFEHVLAWRGAHVTVVGATSGDTGSAAIEAFRGKPHATIFILHPHGRVSEVQRRQMTTASDANVHNIAVEGTFDDCQALVKGLFNDRDFRDRARLSAVNSINWARVMAQIVYYVHAAAALNAEGGIAFTVPTGNFGDIFAGYAASRMGLPVRRLVAATNSNDILARAFGSGRYAVGPVVRTMSPSMDIQVSSNFERLLFDLHDGDGAAVAGLMDGLSRDGAFTLGNAALSRARPLFDAHRIGEDETLATIADLHAHADMLVDPHSAVGVAAARAARQDRDRAVPMVALATAHPAKFPDAVERATGRRPDLPPRLADLMTRPERYDVLPADPARIKAYIDERTRHG